ncbi:hypothetical protein [Flocculibacter collagenilyticus]|uniref:hypothetical protein n=1 Tax=Flocculibacter collagenilyticus TaxID=2744479 RepID=UPI0018F33BD7|nr:hypothetical protein [Flocculibacter collagenilyticus]
MFPHKSLIVLFTLMFASSSSALEQTNKDIYVALAQNLIIKLGELTTAIEQCEAKHQRATITTNEISKCELTESTIDGLMHINNLHELKCSKSLQLEVLQLLTTERNMRHEYKVLEQNIEGVDEHTLKFFDVWQTMLPITTPQTFEAKLMFDSLAAKDQEKLINCKALQRPFDIFSVVDGVRLASTKGTQRQ